jgi:hypothetical protein
MDEAFLANIAERVRTRCQAVPTQAFNRIGAERAIEDAARTAIVEVFLEEFPDAIRPLRVTAKWPFAECWIIEDEAIIKYSFSPETDALMGGIACDPIRIVVRRSPPGLVKRMVSAFKRAKADEMAPVGTPDGRPELKLTKPGAEKQAFRGQSGEKPIDRKAVTVAPKSAGPPPQKAATKPTPSPTTPPRAAPARKRTLS